MEQPLPSKPDMKRQLTKCVKDLYTYCETVNIPYLKQITETEDFSGQCLNLAFRKVLNKISEFSPKNPLFASLKKCIRLLLSLNIDLNFQDDQDPEFKNSTIIHLLCMKSDLHLIKYILEQKIDKSKSIHPINNNINFTLVDAHKRNIFHYLIQHFYTNEKQEIFIIDIFNYFFNNYITNANATLQKVFLKLLVEPDADGNIALTLALLNGWKKLTALILKVSNFQQLVNRDGNNFIHCAIEGNDIKCLKVILYYSELEDLKENNKMMTPLQMAYRKGNITMAKLVEHFERNFHRKGYKEDFLAAKVESDVERFGLMDMFAQGKYEKTVCGIEMWKIMDNVKWCFNNNKDNMINNNNTELINSNCSNNCYNFSLEWNLLLTTYKFLCSRHNTTLNTNSNTSNSNNNTNKKTKNINQPLNTSSFFYNNINTSQYNYCIFHLQDEMKFFFQKHLPLSSNTSHPPPSFSIDILIYNKIIYHLHINDIPTALDTIASYFTTTYPNNTTSYFKWISYVNISFILIDILIHFHYPTLSSIIIESLDKFLFTSNDSYNNDSLYIINDKTIYNYISKYLNGIVIFTQFSEMWDETFCYINLLKILANSDNYSKCKSDYDKLKDKSKYIKTLYVYNKIDILYQCIEYQKQYQLNKPFTYSDNIDIDEKKIYYYNSIAIFNMKLKKYSLAEMYLRNALHIYASILHNNHQTKMIYDIKIEYIYYIKFNIALCLFYKKEFNKAKNIFHMLSKTKVLSRNFYIWYRLGLCYLELELQKRRTKEKRYNDIVKQIAVNEHKNTSYTNANNEDEDKHNAFQQKCSDNSIECDDIDDLYIQFEREYGNCKVNKYKNSSIIKQCKHKQNINNDNENEMNITEYDIKSYQKFFIYDYNYSSSHTQNHIHSKYKKTLSYIQEAIFALKQCILLSTANIFNKTSLHSIYQFYSKSTSHTNSSIFNSAFSSNKDNIPIIINAYESLLFALSLNEEWLQMLFYINELNSHNYNITNEININIQSFHIEALINLHKFSQAEEIIKSNLELYHMSNYKSDYYCKSNSFHYWNIHFKTQLHFNLCLIHLKQNNISAAEECVKLICDNYTEEKMHLPGCVVQLIIYINLIKYNNYTQKEELLEEDKIKKYKYIKTAISLIKTRKKIASPKYYNGQ